MSEAPSPRERNQLLPALRTGGGFGLGMALADVTRLDIRTGEILAMASWPGFNPNDYRKSEPAARRNRNVTDRFEPGSTMKIFTIAAGLDAGVLSPTERLFCEKGAMKLDNVTIRDTHPAEWLPVSTRLH